MPDRTEIVGGADRVLRLAPNHQLPLAGRVGVWLVERGTALVFAVEQRDGHAPGRRHLAANLATGDSVTVTLDRWGDLTLVLVAESGCELRLLSAADMLGRVHDSAALLRAADQRRSGQAATLTARIASAARKDDAAIDAATRALARTVPQRVAKPWRPGGHRAQQVATHAGGDLGAALELVFDALRAMVRPDAGSAGTLTGQNLSQQVWAAAAARGFRSREVTMPRRWWTRDAGPLLGVLADSGHPVALLPDGSRYRLVDPATGEYETLSDGLATRLSPQVFAFVPTLPSRPASVRELIRTGLRGSRRDAVSLAVLANLVGLAGLVVPLVTRVVFGQIVPGSERARLLPVVAALVLVAVAVAFATTARSIAFLRLRTRLDATAQPAVWDRLLSLPAAFFGRYSVGELLTRVQGLDSTRQFLTDAVVATTLSGTFALYNLLLLFAYETSLGVIGLLVTVLQLGLTMGLVRASLGPARRQLLAQSATQSLILELIGGVAKLRVAGALTRGFEVWSRRFAEQRRHAYRFDVWTSRLNVLATVWPTISLLVLVVGIGYLGGADVDPGSFLSFSVALTQVTVGVAAFGAGLSAVVLCVPHLELLQPVLTEETEVAETDAAPGELQGQVELSHVRLRYGADSPLVLTDVSLVARPGQFVAVVGPSGAGKSSLLRLLLGFETPEAGTVSYDGNDLSGLDAAAVRRQIGTVLQSARLIPGTVYSNIAGGTAMSVDAAWAAASAAGLGDDIRAMPMGMQTVISEGAATLSGGQRQRLLIARALGHRPKVLLFDEATSALDNLSQAIVARSVAELGVTRIVIAHRLSTIANADVIYVLDRGRVVQQGDFASLSASDGPFARLAARQLTTSTADVTADVTADGDSRR